MTKLQKDEIKLNKLYNKVKKLPLIEDEQNEINIKGFLYSVGRLNVLQMVAFLTWICLRHKCIMNDIYEELQDDTH